MAQVNLQGKLFLSGIILKLRRIASLGLNPSQQALLLSFVFLTPYFRISSFDLTSSGSISLLYILGSCFVISDFEKSDIFPFGRIGGFFMCFLFLYSISNNWKFDKIELDLAVSIKTFVTLSFPFFIFLVLFSRLTRKDLENVISILGILFVLANLGTFFFEFIEFRNGKFQGDWISIMGSLEEPRFMGYLINPNFVPPHCFLFFFHFLRRRENSKINKIGMVLSLFIIALSLTRAGAIAILSCLIINIFFERKRFSYLLKMTFLISFIYLSSVFLLKSILPLSKDLIPDKVSISKFLKASYNSRIEDNTTLNIRKALWLNAFKTFKMAPIFGVGQGHSAVLNSKIPYTYPEIEYGPHNSYLTILAEVGLIYFTGFLLVIFSVFIQFYSNKINFINCLDFLFLTLIGHLISALSTDWEFLNQSFILLMVFIIIYGYRCSNSQSGSSWAFWSVP